MKKTNWAFSFIALLLALSATVVCAEEDFRGLWVGQATLTHVNEVVIPLDENNDAIAPNPEVPTATADAAHLRLILHVDGSGQVSLLKDVAILQRQEEGEIESLYNNEGDIALVSDERLYSEFPSQEAKRIASAVFDFGDFKATEALNAVVDEIVGQVRDNVWTSGVHSASTTAELREAEDNAQAAAEDGVADEDLIDSADVAKTFSEFMSSTHLTSAKLEAIAAAADPEAEASDLRLEAVALTNTFYADTRTVDAIDAIVAAVENETNSVDKLPAAQFMAARYTDTDNLYQRFITGSEFGDMIPAAAQAAAEVAATNASLTTISNVVHSLPQAVEVGDEASSAPLTLHGDTTAYDTVQDVLNAIADSAAALSSSNGIEALIADKAEEAGMMALAAAPRFSLPVLTPTADYTTFVQSDEFTGSVSGAAEAAAVAAVAEKKNDPFSSEDSLADAAWIAAVQELKSVYILAAKARRTELPMIGKFRPGEGTADLTVDVGAGSLGTAGLTCEINLPASHPTNPFRHIKHPDHTLGIDITRKIRMDFDGTPGDAPGHSNSGLDRVTGIYREEVFGLHKPLGQDSDIGLKVEGTFELNRISLIDTLNAW